MKKTAALLVTFILTLFTTAWTQTPVEQTGSLTVTRTDDRDELCLPGDCSLREAVDAANVSPSADTIDFDSGLTYITLEGSEIVIRASLTLKGPGAHVLTIDGGAGTNRIFYINNSKVTISGLTLTGGGGTDGAAVYGHGGAIFAVGGSISIDSVHVTGNSAPGFGGGIALSLDPYPTPAIITNSTISGNFAIYGGGGVSIYNGKVTLLNSTISGNDGGRSGGGIFVSDTYEMKMHNVTVTKNVAEYGGAIYVWDITYIDFGNTILSGNKAARIGQGPEIYLDTPYNRFRSLGGNLVGDSPGDSTNTGSIGVSYLLTDIRDRSPLLGPLQNNGGTTNTHALLSRSPAIDGGLNELAINPTTGIKLNFDQRGTGFPRVRSGNGLVRATVDIGAFEFAANESPNRVGTEPDRSMNSGIVSLIVSNTEELYSAVNDPRNANTQIALAPGQYALSATDPNKVPRPNAGRLELKENMSLIGVIGNRGAVVLDAAGLPASSFQNPVTGVIRVGLGNNSVEWLTINGHPVATGGIETDLLWASGPSRVRVAHVVSGGSNRGVDVRTIGDPGRMLEADIIDSEFFGGFEGIRVIIQNDAPGAVTRVRMSNNNSHDNEHGCLIENARTSFARIEVQSQADLFTGNGLGCLVGGALIGGANTANSNYVSFKANGSRFINNNGPIFTDQGGLLAIGAISGVANATSDNALDVHLWNCQIYGNLGVNFEALGSRSSSGAVAGMNNHARIYLYGTSRSIDVLATNSVPTDPIGTNTVTVTRPWFPFPWIDLDQTNIHGAPGNYGETIKPR